ncbi:MAG: GlsB/YeaQ/YmgE family stress response membrane protein [Verrucomicrobiaceae bacterium]|nr:GlsB/YeaQ/YmgE family stress response membrane protein [Verrucomicrobiaceae bacterium]
MNYFYWALLGLIAGALGKFIMPGKDGGGIIKTILLGIIGALVGGYIGENYLKLGNLNDGLNIKSIIVATGGSLLVLIIYRMVKKAT